MSRTTDLPEEGIGGMSPSRPGAAVLTSTRLGEAWPEVSARLVRMLTSRGADPALRDDIVQEVAVRALDKQVPFTDPADLYRWAAVTARNLHIDHLRSGGRMVGDDELVAMPDGTDVAHAAERRVALGHVWRALAVMRPGEREAILDSLRTDGVPCTSQALVRRHRARATLRRAVGGMMVTLTTWRLRMREYVDTAAPGLRAAGAVVVMTPLVAYQLSGLVPGPGTAPGAEVRRQRTVVVNDATSVHPEPDPTDDPTPAPSPSPSGTPDGGDPEPTGSPTPTPTTIEVPGVDPKVVTEPTTEPTDAKTLCVKVDQELPEVCSPV